MIARAAAVTAVPVAPAQGPFARPTRPCVPAPAAALALALGAAALAGCASQAPLSCAAGLQPMHGELLYFGTRTPQGTVTAQEWQDFLSGTLSARFPAGLSVWPAGGQWQPARGPALSEASYLVSIVHPGGDVADAAFGEVIALYKARFQQDSVLRVSTRVCAGF